jgi:hypothetical protein
MDSLASRWWLGAALVAKASEVDPQGEFADPFVRPRAGGWYSKAPPLLPLVASVPYAVLGTLGAYAIPGLSAVACFVLAARLEGRYAAVASVAATPVAVHGALFCGHALAAALVLGSAALFLDAGAPAGPAGRPGLRPLGGAALCAALAALAQPSAIAFLPAGLGAWLILRRASFARGWPEGDARRRAAFLALASGLHVALSISAHGLLAGAGRPSWGPEWGWKPLLPVTAPAALAVAAAVRASGAVRPAPRPRARRALGALVAAGIVLEAAGLGHLLSARASNARAVRALAEAARPGDAVVTDDPALPSLAATLTPDRAILYVPAGAGPGEAIAALDAAGAPAVVLATRPGAADRSDSPAREAAHRTLGVFAREGEAAAFGRLALTRFVRTAPIASRPSAPPRGD